MEQKPAQKREQAILEAAEREFLKKGFDGARTTSIAAAAGVTHAMLHYYPERYEAMQRQIRSLMGVMLIDTQRALDEAADRGEIRRIDVRMLMLDIISLNVFVFIAYPILEPLLGDLTADRERFFELRKAETVETVMRRLKITENP